MSPVRSFGVLSTALALAALLVGCGSSSSGGGADLGATATDGPTAAPTAQTCQHRLHGRVSGPPKAIPRVAGTIFQSQQPSSGLYAGLLPGVDNVGAAGKLHQQFVSRGYKTSSVKTNGTASSFTFSGDTQGTAAVGILCRGHLRVLYQFVKPTTSTGSTPPAPSNSYTTGGNPPASAGK